MIGRIWSYHVCAVLGLAATLGPGALAGEAQPPNVRL